MTLIENMIKNAVSEVTFFNWKILCQSSGLEAKTNKAVSFFLLKNLGFIMGPYGSEETTEVVSGSVK